MKHGLADLSREALEIINQAEHKITEANGVKVALVAYQADK